MGVNKVSHKLNAFLIASVLILFCASISLAGEKITQVSEKELYKISYVCHHLEMKIKEFHSGELVIRTMDDKPVTDAKIIVDFVMPEHGGHKSMRRPVVSKHINGGTYKVNLINFQMPGQWQMTVHVKSKNKEDKAVFDLMIKGADEGDHTKHMQ
jgi:hypothetical protein